MRTGIHLFTRDLRIQDNTALDEINKACDEVICCFILDDQQVEKNKYYSEKAARFMNASLKELDEELRKKGSRLNIFKGKTEEIIQRLLEEQKIDVLSCTKDYTPYARSREAKLTKICTQHNVKLTIHTDYLLHEAEEIRTKQGTPYSVFTPYYQSARGINVRKAKHEKKNKYSKKTLKGTTTIKGIEETATIKGGRKEGLRLLKRIKEYKDYKKERDIPALDATTHLSAHLKFGTVSIREAYWKIVEELGENHELIRQLHFRDFFTHIAYNNPHVFGKAYQKKYDKLRWSGKEEWFEAWCSGKTGYPIIDAGMRELNETGYMHNRVRMIVASFLVKDLHIDWRKGERYFATRLVDYDPCVNNSNWQWAASTGCDAQPYFRVFNPFRQQQRFDKECVYVKRWVQELQDLSAKEIHGLEKKRPDGLSQESYPQPIVEHKEMAAIAKAMYKQA